MTHHFDPATYAGLPLFQTRRQVSDEIERMIAFLDSLDPDCDLEPNGDEQDASYCEGRCRYVAHPCEDDEPSLGWSVSVCQDGPGFHLYSDDREDEHDGREPNNDREASIGWTAATNQDSVNWFPTADAWMEGIEFDPAEMGIADEGGLAEQMMRVAS